ncbi:MAG: glucose-1-phosphate adenylyltransferase subunit GlgD [Clostridiales bacterium]|nr:glucose-1-phosphate adenylyltransferase subunit GlgD [Clostridiales bacterium]
MKNVTGIIFSTCYDDILMSLTKERPISTVPFGGRYRLIDFALSNMVNTGIRTVGIVTPQNYRSLLDHIRSGKDWFLDRKSGGLFILPSSKSGEEGPGPDSLLKDMLYNLDFLRKSRDEYVIISSCNIVMNANYREALNFHISNDNDITLIYKEERSRDNEREDVLLIDQAEDRRVRAVLRSDKDKLYRASKTLLDIAIINRELLIEILKGHDGQENINFFELLGRLVDKLRIYALEFRGYTGRILSINSYFQHSMDLLNPRVRTELFMKRDKIHTKITDNPPTRYGENALVANSLVGSGCKIDGQVENSILFREAEIGKGSVVMNSIIMQKNIIGKDVLLENVILDKFVTIKDGTILRGEEDNPLTIDKGAIIGPEEVSHEKYNLRSG